MKKMIIRYRWVGLIVVLLAIVYMVDKNVGATAVKNTQKTLLEMLLILPPIFVLLGLLDVWVPRQIMTKYMGKGSGIIGIILSFLLGSAAAGPLYGAFPVASVFMKKGVSFPNIMIFIGAWSTTKIPMFLFEMKSLGARFALTRLALNIPGIIIIAYLITTFVSHKEIDHIYENNTNTEKKTLS